MFKEDLIGDITNVDTQATDDVSKTVGGAVGGLVGTLVDSGIDKEDAQEYEAYLNRGNILVAVDIKPNIEREHIMGYYNENNSLIRDRYNDRQI